MNIFENTEMAVKTLTANKLRTLLTMLGIIIGNASVIAMVAIGEGAKQFTQEKLESIGPNQLAVIAKNSDSDGSTTEQSEITLADVEAIAEQAPAVAQVAPQITSSLQVTYRGRTSKATVTGTTMGMLYVRNLQVQNGRFLDSDKQQSSSVVILGSAVAQKLFLKENPIGKDLQINNISFQVIGVMQQKGSFLGTNYDEAVYIPILTAANQLISKRSPRGITVDYTELSAKDKDSVRAAAFQVANILTRRHGKKDFSIFANKSMQDLVAQVTGGLSLLLATVAGISLLVGGIGIMNIMLVSVSERTHEIGLRKAIGASEGAILSQFLIEAIILSVTGGLIGTGLGVSTAVIVSLVTPLKPAVPVAAIILAGGISGTIGLVFGVTPARQAAKLDPINALRGA
ncbi:MAG: ABC transporter permease [Scytonematopsis contorta HA4267-MV1]|jgi:putative ABC transport system permease protein|nr:ABC transporter permease [Scytonematopsis contorta HA4267-MV1]